MENRILSAICTSLGLENANVGISQVNCANWDSMRHLNLIVELESEFDVEFEPEEIAEMKDYYHIKHILEEKLRGSVHE